MRDKVFYMLVTRGDERNIIVLHDYDRSVEESLEQAGWIIEIIGRTEVGDSEQYIYLYNKEEGK